MEHRQRQIKVRSRRWWVHKRWGRDAFEFFYPTRSDWRTRKVTASREGVFYPTRLASPQGALIPLTPQESLRLYHPQTRQRPVHQSLSTQP
jgi:hypothetical protein